MSRERFPNGNSSSDIDDELKTGKKPRDRIKRGSGIIEDIRPIDLESPNPEKTNGAVAPLNYLEQMSQMTIDSLRKEEERLTRESPVGWHPVDENFRSAMQEVADEEKKTEEGREMLAQYKESQIASEALSRDHVDAIEMNQHHNLDEHLALNTQLRAAERENLSQELQRKDLEDAAFDKAHERAFNINNQMTDLESRISSLTKQVIQERQKIESSHDHRNESTSTRNFKAEKQAAKDAFRQQGGESGDLKRYESARIEYVKTMADIQQAEAITSIRKNLRKEGGKEKKDVLFRRASEVKEDTWNEPVIHPEHDLFKKELHRAIANHQGFVLVDTPVDAKTEESKKEELKTENKTEAAHEKPSTPSKESLFSFSSA